MITYGLLCIFIHQKNSRLNYKKNNNNICNKSSQRLSNMEQDKLTKLQYIHLVKMVVIIIVKILKETPSVDIGASTPLSKCSVCWFCVRNQINTPGTVHKWVPHIWEYHVPFTHKSSGSLCAIILLCRSSMLTGIVVVVIVW